MRVLALLFMMRRIEVEGTSANFDTRHRAMATPPAPHRLKGRELSGGCGNTECEPQINPRHRDDSSPNPDTG